MSLSRLGTFFKKHPLISNCAIYGTFCVTAEFIQQTYNKQCVENQSIKKIDAKVDPSNTLRWNSLKNLRWEDYDWPILARYCTYGYCIAGPLLYKWYSWLDKAFMGTSKKVVITKVLCDQFIFTPPLLVVFFTSMSIMEQKDDIFHECKTKFLKTFQTSCYFWIPVQTINFLLVIPKYRVLYVSIASFCWINILCMLKRKSIFAF